LRPGVAGGGEETEELVRLEDWTIGSWKQKETNQKTQYSTRLLGVLKK
jgi:hypothetical protein